MGWIALALAFAALWVYALYREDFRNPEPIWMVLLSVGAGVLAAVLADHAEHRLVPDLSILDGTLLQRVYVSFVVAGPVEEAAKLLAVLLIVRPWSHFDEPLDGIVYGAAAGAGFALAENLAFMQDQPDIILARGPVGTGAHALFSALWGGALGHAGLLRGRLRRGGMILLGLAVAAAAHGAFDVIVFSVGQELTPEQGRGLQIALIVGCLIVLRWRIRAAQAHASFRMPPEASAAGTG